MKNLLARIFLSIIAVIITILVLVTAALAYCAFDRKSALSSIPRNYSIYLHTDSAFDTVNPLFDLQAADVFLSSPEYSSLRKSFMDFRSSDLRDNKFVRFAASRQVDFALYGEGANIGRDSHFVAVLNLGFFSIATRVGSYMYPKLNLSDSQNEFLKNLSYETNEQTSYFVYKTQELTIYLKSVKNLLIASDSFEHLITASLVENDTSYTPAQKKLFRSGKKGELRIVADASSLMHSVTDGNPILSSMSNLISSDSLSVISFNITD